MEHAFTLPRIKAFIEARGMTMLGLEVSPDTLRQFLDASPGPGGRHDLDLWHAFEQAHPHAFEAMYFFWVSAAGGPGRGG